ncbi:hypothetical protein CK203_002987 [Vitis vinifera]|uniref:Uncharacterized protein n=1 Tax=Vitis vinifera TaxID=29760 RepID=A0A438K746_VITVI|nr:hypothetical protein CK203_002987 [Vitis vinifera]
MKLLDQFYQMPILKNPQDAKSPADVGDDQNSVPDSSSRPYDPLTNYLSPRPKFLRSVSFESQNASDEDGARDTSSQGGSVQPEDEEIVEDEEDIEEEEEQRGWSLKGSHIFGAASVKGLEDGLSQAIEGVQNGYLKIQSHMFGATSVKNSESGSEFMEQQEDRKMGLIEANQGAVEGEVAGDENGGVAEETDELGQVVELQQGEENEDLCGREMGKTLDVSDRMAENLEFQEKTAEKLEQVEDDSDVGGAGNEEMVADEIEGVEDLTNKENTNVGVANLEPEVNLKEGESSVVVVPPNGDEDHIEKVESYADPSVEEASQEFSHIEKVESYADPSVEEASQEFSQSRAPKVELLGEYVVGEVCSTPKIYSMKSRMMMEGEESNHYSVSQEKGGTHSIPIRTQATLSALSTMDSPSYGSFTAEKSIRKKEDGRDGEVKKIVTTPVRRSSRIRTRAIMSP